MKLLPVLLIGGLLPVAVLAAEPAPPKGASKGAVVQRVEGASGLQRLLDEMWAKLRSYGPRLQGAESAQARDSQVAGVRGAESTTSTLSPYWKGDRSGDPAFVAEVNAYNRAQDLAESGNPAGAAQAFEEFLKAYPKSPLRPNAQFGLALAHGARGERAGANAALEVFVREHPNHPLVADARRLGEALAKP